MHGLINRTIQCFVRDTYGEPRWLQIAMATEQGLTDFEAMLQYDSAITDQLLQAACHILDKPRDTLLEDIGTYLVSHPNVESLRRLLRFGGTDFTEFLFSLEDLPGRARFAVPDLHLPDMEVEEEEREGQFRLHVTGGLDGFSVVIMGILRAIADDFGALVFLEPVATSEQSDTIAISVVEAEFAEGRRFDLGAVV